MPQGEGSRFACQFDGCSRSFSRQEHLQRHVLNHADGEFTCERCRTVFKRPDLLGIVGVLPPGPHKMLKERPERHMARHRRKDAEGGTLMTRKRLWKDSDGRVVNRPAKEARTATAQPPQFEAAAFPPSPPKSASDPAVSPSSADITAAQGDRQDFERPNHTAIEDFGNIAHDDFWDTSLQATYDSSYSTGPFDDIFAPDTASSFNMPYTTVNNYNWLFDLDLNPMETYDSLGENSMAKIPEIFSNKDGLMNELPAGLSTTSCTTSVMKNHARAPKHFKEQRREGTEIDRGFLLGEHAMPNENLDQTMEAQSSQGPGPVHEAPMAYLRSDSNLPEIDEVAQERMLDIIEISRPTTPDGIPVSVENPLLSLASLQSWLDLFFLRFNTVYPLMHVPTFEPSETEPVLLLSMLLLGATYADKDAHQLAVCIHDVLRPQIFSNPGFSAKPELWVLQATLLTECLGKSRAGQKQHDMSHLFHGLLINLIRRSDCQSIAPEKEIDPKDDAETSWRSWAIAEQKKRLAQLCFVWDVQHAVLFSQSLCMSAFELRSTLPCDQTIWEARSVTEWHKASRQTNQKPPRLLTGLKQYLTSPCSQPRDLNLLGHIVLLHGLMSISWDMERRDQTSLGLVGDKIASGSWKDRMSRAYDSWRAGFDAYISRLKSNHQQLNLDDEHERKLARGLDTYIASYGALYHAAQLTLAADILDLQIYAGARHILGRPVSKIDYVRSQKVVKAWLGDDTSTAALAAWHAAQLLQLSLNTTSVGVNGDIFHHPWTLFLANLVVWTFYQAIKTCTAASLDDEMIWDVKEDMAQLLQTMTAVAPEQLTAQQKPSTAGLTAVVVKNLSKIRWGVIHDGMLVLRGLVQWRLINDDDIRA